MKRVIIPLLALMALGGVGCTTSRLTDPVDRSVDRALDRVDQSVVDARKEISELVKEAKASTSSSIEEAKRAAQEVRVDVKSDIDDLEKKLGERLEEIDKRAAERIDQAFTKANEFVATTDRTVGERIDRLLSEVRLLVREVIAEIKSMIAPILVLAEKLGNTVESGQRAILATISAIDGISTKTQNLIVSVDKTIVEVQASIHALRTGKNPDGTDATGLFGIIGGVLAGALGWLKARGVEKQRAEEKTKEGERWKPEELILEVKRAILNGDLDKELQARQYFLTNKDFPQSVPVTETPKPS